ncbi:putative symporter YjmB [Acetatifactor muris]|uniref:Putative symporter YjmB n=2 Tax=Acetatifactor muris TaxID=879566 RepID=A0A2K4ZPQ1_9FIRM|nr:putative symporter YjmB [Acetatifactor muris]
MNLNQGKNKKIFLLRGQKRRILFSFLCNDKCDWNLQQLWIADWTPAEMEDVMVTDDRGDRKTDASGEIRPFGLRDKIGYMFGDFGNDFSFIFASNYLMVFYTKVLGLSGFVVGLLFLGARFVDAFTDVTMGRIVDYMRPAGDGRFRCWIRRMCVPVAVASSVMYLYFVRDWVYWAKLVYVIFTYLLWSSFCYTAINIPYGSMASVISPDVKDRASLSTFRSIGASLAGLVIGVLVPLIVYETDLEGNQVVRPVNFTVTAFVFGILAVGCYVLCYLLCQERVVFAKKEGKKESVWSMLAGLGKNRPLLALVCAALVLLLATLLSQTMNNYLFLDYFKNAKALSVVNVVGIGGTLLLAPFISVIVSRIGKKEAGAAGMLLAGVVYVILFFLQVKSILLFMVLFFLGTLGTGLFNLIIWAFITDIIDYQEIATGRREDGTVYAVYSFARKVGQALAGGLGGFVLTAIGYISEAPAQTWEVSRRIYMVATLVPGICYLAVFLIVQFAYPLTRGEVEKNTAILRNKRQEQAGEAGIQRDEKST